MISLREHIDRHTKAPASSPGSGTKELLPAYRAAFQSTLLAMGECGSRAVPGLGAELNDRLGQCHASLGPATTPGTVTRVTQQVLEDLAQWANRAVRSHEENEREIREIISVVSRAADSVSQRDETYARDMNGIGSGLKAIAEMNDLAVMRRSILESTQTLKACVEKMAAESKASVQSLTSEVAEYRARLAESERISRIDSLTGLANRRAFENQLAAKIADARPFCLILVDLNDFKMINDRFGHVAGDDLLRQFAVELRAQFRTGDLVGRWGGDEFVMITSSGMEDAGDRADRVRKWALGEYRIKTGPAPFVQEKVQVSAAVALVEWDGKENGTALVARADGLVYRAKDAARKGKAK